MTINTRLGLFLQLFSTRACILYNHIKYLDPSIQCKMQALMHGIHGKGNDVALYWSPRYDLTSLMPH